LGLGLDLVIWLHTGSQGRPKASPATQTA